MTPEREEVRILVLYHSQGGKTLAMAEQAARGVNDIEGAQAALKNAAQADLGDLLACQGLIVGSPEYFGYMAGRIKDFFDRTYEQARGLSGVFRKPYSIFICAGNDGSGALAAIERICLGYQFKKVFEPVVCRGGPGPEIMAACFEMGQTLAAGCQAGIY